MLQTKFATIWFGGHLISEIALLSGFLYLFIRHGFKSSFIYGTALFVIHEGEWVAFYLLRGYPANFAQFFYPLAGYGPTDWLIILYLFLAVFVLKDVDWPALSRMALIMLPYFIMWFALGLPTYSNAFGPTQYYHVVWVNLFGIGSWIYGCVGMIWAYEHPSVFTSKASQNAQSIREPKASKSHATG